MRSLFVCILIIFEWLTFSGNDALQSSGCSTSTTSNLGGLTQQFSFVHGGINRMYYIHFPTNYDSNLLSGHPMIMAFPGYTTTADYFKNNFKMNSQSDEYNYIAVYLQGSQFDGTISWNDISCTSSPGSRGPTCMESAKFSVGYPDDCALNPNDGCNWCNCHVDDVDYIDKLGEYLENTYCIDVSKEYAIGYSNGGMMAHRVACELNDRFAAVSTFHGRQHIGFDCVPQNTQNKMPIMNICGSTDNIIPCYQELSPQDKWWYLTADSVTLDFAQFNECDIINDPFNNQISTISDGQRGWKCYGYDENCIDNAKAVFCEWNGGHTYPVKGQNNFGLRAAWQFMNQYNRGGSSPVSPPTQPPITPITPSPTNHNQCFTRNQQCSQNTDCCSNNCKGNGLCK